MVSERANSRSELQDLWATAQRSRVRNHQAFSRIAYAIGWPQFRKFSSTLVCVFDLYLFKVIEGVPILLRVRPNTTIHIFRCLTGHSSGEAVYTRAMNITVRQIRSISMIILCAWLSQSAYASDPRADIERASELIGEERYAFARTYLNPALVSPFLSSSERSRAYYFRGFTFNAQGMPVSARKDYNRALEFNPANPAALVALGRLHALGRGIEQSDELAVSLYQQAAELDYLPAKFHMGHAYLNGAGIEKNLLRARELLTEAADEDHPFAMLSLAASYRAEHVTSAEPEMAKQWYEKAFAAGEPAAMLALGRMYVAGEFGEPELEQGFAYVKQAAEGGVAEAQALLGYMYLVGEGTALDEAKALEMYRLGAERGSLGGQLGYAHMLEHGIATDADKSAAQSWYERAARGGNIEAQLRLANLLSSSEAAEDQRAVMYWRAQAADSGSAKAYNDYAWMLATSKIDALRNGTLALDQAQKAVAQEPRAEYLDTLAAAYAEVGNFERAVEVQLRALGALTEEQLALRPELELRLNAYRRSEAWRE